MLDEADEVAAAVRRNAEPRDGVVALREPRTLLVGLEDHTGLLGTAEEGDLELVELAAVLRARGELDLLEERERRAPQLALLHVGALEAEAELRQRLQQLRLARQRDDLDRVQVALVDRASDLELGPHAHPHARKLVTLDVGQRRLVGHLERERILLALVGPDDHAARDRLRGEPLRGVELAVVGLDLDDRLQRDRDAVDLLLDVAALDVDDAGDLLTGTNGRVRQDGVDRCGAGAHLRCELLEHERESTPASKSPSLTPGGERPAPPARVRVPSRSARRARSRRPRRPLPARSRSRRPRR